MICISIYGDSEKEVLDLLLEAQKDAELGELRLDLCSAEIARCLKAIVRKSPLPLLLTYRSYEQGGKGEEHQRDFYFQKMQEANPFLMDFEWDSDQERFENHKIACSHIKTLISWHGAAENFSEVKKIYNRMKKNAADYYKIAWNFFSSTEALKLFNFMSGENQLQPKTVFMGLGAGSQFLRILAKKGGAPFTFAALSEKFKTVPGQLTAKDLKEVYHFDKIGLETELYGLIGNPIDQSHSHNTHNRVFRNLKRDAVYVKMPVRHGELKEFLVEASLADFKGLSITMPLKQEVLKQEAVFELGALRAGAANTLKKTENGWAGSNTDGSGVLVALQERAELHGKRAVILGAGGTAQSIAWNLAKVGVQVVILNRTPERGKELARMIGAEFGPLSDIRKWKNAGYDFLIQATSIGMAPNIEETPIPTSEILPGTLVFDVISNPPETRLLKEAKKLGCEVIGGGVMFYFQARMQFERWFGTVDSDKIKPIFELYFGEKVCSS